MNHLVLSDGRTTVRNCRHSIVLLLPKLLLLVLLRIHSLSSASVFRLIKTNGRSNTTILGGRNNGRVIVQHTTILRQHCRFCRHHCFLLLLMLLLKLMLRVLTFRIRIMLQGQRSSRSWRVLPILLQRRWTIYKIFVWSIIFVVVVHWRRNTVMAVVSVCGDATVNGRWTFFKRNPSRSFFSNIVNTRGRRTTERIIIG